MKYLLFFLSVLFFIRSHSQDKLAADSFIHTYGHLTGSFQNMIEKKKCTVAFLGGSITQGPGWKDKLVAYLESAYPETVFSFIYAGVASLGSVPHSFRLQRDVLDKGKVDLLFLETAVNDHVNQTPPEQQERAMEGIIRHALQNNPLMNIVLMAFVDEDKIADYDAGKEPPEITLHNALAKHYRLPFINLAKEVQQRIKNREFTWKDDFKDLHPSPFGQELYYSTIKRLLEKEYAAYHAAPSTPAGYLPASIYTGIYDKGRYTPPEEASGLHNFLLVNNWQPADGKPTRPGFVNVPVLEGNGSPASLNLSFTGNAIGICIVSGPDAGRIRYSIDGGTQKETDLHTEWSNSLHLPWYLVLADNLTDKKHTLRLEVIPHPESQERNTCRIVHFLVNNQLP